MKTKNKEEYYINFKKGIKKLDTSTLQLKLDSAYKVHMFNIGLLNGLIIEQERLSREMYMLIKELKERGGNNVISNQKKKRTNC